MSLEEVVKLLLPEELAIDEDLRNDLLIDIESFHGAI